MFHGIREILIFASEPKNAADWFSKFFGQPLCCVEKPEHQCRLRVGEHEIRFQRANAVLDAEPRQATCWNVTELASHLLRGHRLGAKLHRCPIERGENDYLALLEVPHCGLLGLVGPLAQPPVPGLTLPQVRAHRLEDGRLRRRMALSGDVRAEVELTGSSGYVDAGGAYGGYLLLRVRGTDVLGGYALAGTLAHLPFELQNAGKPVFGSVEVRLERSWTGFLRIAEFRLRFQGRILYEEKEGEPASLSHSLPIPADPPRLSGENLPRPASEDG